MWGDHFPRKVNDFRWGRSGLVVKRIISFFGQTYLGLESSRTNAKPSIGYLQKKQEKLVRCSEERPTPFSGNARENKRVIFRIWAKWVFYTERWTIFQSGLICSVYNLGHLAGSEARLRIDTKAVSLYKHHPKTRRMSVKVVGMARYACVSFSSLSSFSYLDMIFIIVYEDAHLS